MAGIKTNRFPVLRGGATGLQIDGGGGVFVQLSTPLCDIRVCLQFFANAIAPNATPYLGLYAAVSAQIWIADRSGLGGHLWRQTGTLAGETDQFINCTATFTVHCSFIMPICSGHAHHLPIFGLQSDLCTGVAQIQITDEAFSSHWRLAEKLKKLRKYPLSTWAILAGRQNILNPVFVSNT